MLQDDDSGMTFTSLMARSNLFPQAHEWEKLKKCTFLCGVVLCDMQCS